MLLTLVAGNALAQTSYLIPNDGTTSTLDLTDKAVGYSCKIYDASGPNANYDIYTEGTLLVKVANGMCLNISGTVKANDDDEVEYFAIYDGSTVEDNLLGKFGEPSGQFVSVAGSTSNMLLHFLTYGWECYEGVEVTATIAVKDGDFVYADNAKTHLIKYVGAGGTVEIPSAVTNIDCNAFYGCNNLNYNTVGGLNYIGGSSNQYLFLVGPTSTGITECTINSNTKYIGREAFKDCSNLTTINVPSGVTSIGDNAFAGLVNVVYSGSAGTENDSWGANVRNGEVVGDFLLGSNGTVIGAYYGEGGAIIVIPQAVTTICGHVFENSGITSVDFSQATGLTTIGDYAFSNCDELTTVTIPASVTTMGYRVFDGCDNISTIYCVGDASASGWDSEWNYGYFYGWGWKRVPTIWDYNNWSIDENGELSFNKDYRCTSYDTYPWYALRSQIKSVKVGADVTTIGDYAFDNTYGSYRNLVSVDFSEATNLVEIGYHAFYSNNGITTLNIPQMVSSIGYEAFIGVKCINYYGNAGSSSDKWGARVRNGYVEDGFVYSDNTKTYLASYIGDGGSINIPSGVVTIGSGAFSDCTTLTAVSIPASVQAIYDNAFYNCSALTTVNIPASVEYISYNAFYGCSSLATVDMSNATNLRYIYDCAFFDCTTLTAVSLPASVEYIGSSAFSSCSSLETVDMSNATNLRYICSYAFSDCAALSSVSIPESIVRVDYDAFYNCSSSLFTQQGGFYYLGNNTNPYVVLMKPVTPGNISTLRVENGVKAVAVNAFNGCTAFPTTENGASYVGSSSNSYLILAKASSTEITSCTINSNTKIIAPFAFWDCCELSNQKVTIPEGIELMGYQAFGCGNGSAPKFECNEGSQPARWDEYWNPNGGQVVWGADSYEIDANGVLTINKCVDANNYTDYPWYSKAESITKVVFAEGVSCVGKYAFYNYNLTEVVIPSTMESIGDYAFRYCYNLSDINLDDATSLTSIGDNAFDNCDALTNINLGNATSLTSIGKYAFYSCDILSDINLDNATSLTTIGEYAFAYCNTLTDINLSNATNLTSICKYAFYYCNHLETIELPSSVTFIGEYAFNSYSNLEYNVSEGVRYLGNTSNPYLYLAKVNSTSDEQYTINANTRFIGINAFSGCSNLSSITIPASVTSIGYNAFGGCSKLITIDVPSTVTYIERNAFNDVGNINYNGPYGTATDTWGAGARNGSIDDNFVYADATRTTIVKYIGSDTEVTIPASVETIGNHAFEYKGITSVDFSQATQLTQIGEYAFCNTSLTEVAIPASVETIGAFAFYECHQLESVDFSSAISLATIDQYAFYYCNKLTSVVIPESVVIIGNYAFQYCNSLTEVAVPSSVKSVGSYVFSNCESLTEVDFSQATSLISIGYYVFSGCSNLLSSIEIPSTVTNISSDAFYGIKNIIYNGSAGGATEKFGALTRNGTFDGNFVFADEAKTALTGYTCKSGSVTIPDGVKTIGAYAFDKCSDVTVTIPSALSISSIGQYAFNDIANVINYNSYETNSPWGAKKYFKSSDIDIDENGFIFTAGSERTELIGYMGSATDIVIPQTVTTIADEVFKDLSITSVDFSSAENLESIGQYAFYNCDNLTSIYIPATVTSMGYYAFADCSNLSINCAAADRPDGWDYSWNPSNRPVRWLCDAWSIDETGLLTVKADVSCNWNQYPWYRYKNYYNNNITGVAFAEGVTTIGEGAFYDANWRGYYNYIATVTIPSTVTTIGGNAFYSCSNITSVYYASLSSLCGIDFEDKDSNPLNNGATLYINGEEKTEITIPAEVTSIGQYAFYNCDNITKVVIHDGVEIVGYYAFYSCDNLTIWCEAGAKPEGWHSNWNPSGRTVIWDMNNWSLSDDGLLTVKKSFSYENSSSYPWYYFQSDIKAVKFEAAVTEIGNNAFYDYDNLLTVDFSEATGLTSIGYRTFCSCSYLTTVDMSGATSLTTIGSEAFYESNRISRVDFASEKSLLEMQYADSYSNPLRNGANAFINDVETAEIVVPENVTAIGQYALYGCSNLTKIVVHGNVAEMGTCAIDGSSELVIWCEAESKPDGWNSSWNPDGHTVMWDYKNWSLSDDGLLTVKKSFSYDYSEDYPWNYFQSDIKTVKLEAAVTEIGNNAFYDYDNLLTVDFSEATGLTSIGQYAFNNCDNLESVTIPAAVTKIGSSAFNDCDNLKTVDLSNTAVLKTIGDYAFSSCDNLESVTIPAAVTEIGDYAFSNCSSLATVELSDNASLKSIGERAFYYCGALSSIDLSKAKVLEEIGGYAFYECDKLTSVYIPLSVESIGEFAFSYSDNLSIINCEATSAGDNWDGNWNYKNGNYYPVAWDCTNWSLSSDGLLTVKKQYNFESKEAYPWYELRSQITGVEFDNSNATFTSIGNYAFYCYSNLQTATIPAGVTAIGDHAFQGCNNLKVVDLSNTTTLATIGDYAFYGCGELQSLTIPSTVTSIGNDAFRECQKLETIDLSKLTSLESIGSRAFYNCDQLASAYIPLSVQSVGEYAFYSCDNLGLIYIEAETLVPDGWDSNWSNYNNVAWDCTNWSLSASGKLTIKKQFTAENAESYPWYQMRSQITSVEFDNSNATFTAIGNYAFYGCENLTAIEISATVESIGNYAFYGCQKLESVELSDNTSLESIGNHAFYECNALADIDLSKATKLKTIGQYAFYNCDGLTTMTIPASVTFIDNEVFSYSENMQFISCEAPSFPDGWNGSWNYGYFNYSWKHLPVLWDCNNMSLSNDGMLTVSKDYEFESYDNYPWYNLKGLIKGVTFESGVTVIGDYAFYNWGSYYPNLATVVIPATVASIGNYAFYYCQNLTSADLKGAYGLTTIGNYAFYECGLTEITIPANVTTIEEGAFEYCSNVESINLSGATSLETIETNAFFDCFKTFNIDVPSNVTYIGDGAFQNIKNLKYSGSYGDPSDTWGALARNAYVDGDFTYRDGTKTYLLGYTGNGGNITIPSTVVTIGDNVFAEKENITGVEITANVMQIGSSAFADCSNLATVNLSNATNLTTIGSGAFSGCNALTSVTIPSTVTSINNRAFNYCESLVTVDLSNATSLKTIGSSAFNYCENLSRVDLSNATSLEYIDNYVFYGCAALQSIVIPSKVEYIGSYAFQNCTSLRTVNLNNATGLYHIYNNAFDGCYNLYTIDLSKATNLEYIDGYAFSDCDALTQVTIPAKVGSISDGAFSDCNNLATVNMSNAKNLGYIGHYAFQECALTSVAIPENVTSIGDYAFGDCSSLSSVSIPNGIVHVGENAFSNCNNLTFTQSNGFCYLGNSQNQYVVLVKPVAAGDLSSCTVNSGVKIVAVGAFNNCTVFPTTENGACYVGNNSNPYLILARAESQDISSCTINSNTRIIAPRAFWNCYSLSSLDIPVGVEHVGYYAVGYYYGAPEVNCYTGDPSQWDGAWNPYGNNTNWAVDGWEFNEVSGLLTVKTDVVLWHQSYYPWYDLISSIREIQFTDNVSRIGDYAFYNYYNLTKVTIPASVTSIGYEAFYNCNGLSTVDFSNASGLQSIGYEAFAYCYNLNNADLSGATNLKSIGSYAFYYDNLNKIVIPASVEEIGYYVFWYWNSNVALCEANGPAEGWDDNWTTYAKIWHYNNNALTLTVNNSSYGSVRTNTVNDVDVNQVIPNGIYTYGDVVSIEAVSNSGSIFLRWNDGVTDNQRDITITDNLSLEAIFGSDGTVYTVNVGTNNSNWGTVTGTGNYVSGDYVELEAVPAEHYHFVRWSDDEENTDPNRSFYIDSDVSFSAVFEPDPCMVTVNVTGNGTVENEAQYGYATCPTIYAYPEEGWYLAYWTTPDGTYFDNNHGFWIYNDTELTAVFKPVQNVTVGTNIVEAYGRKYNNCKFEAEVSGEYVIYGASINNYPYIYVYDAYGYELAQTSGSDRITIDLEAGETYYIGAGNNNSAIEKMQLFIMASVSITAQGNGGTFEGDGEYTYGDDVTVTATPNEGMFFVKWSDGENKNVYSLKAYGNTTLNAEFSAIHQAVEGDNTVVGFYSGVTENYNCQFTPSYSGPYVFFSQSENDTYGILYDENKTVLESDDNSGENGNFSFTYELEAGKTYYIAASYVYTGNAGDEMNLVIGTPVNVTATVDGNGSVLGAGLYAYGSKVTLRANPESGNRFVRWSDLSTANPYQFTVYEDVELQAIFADESEDVYAVSAVVNNNSYGSVSGGSNYTAGERVELAVTANSGYTFICWTDGNSQNPRVFNASENVSLMAVLTPEGTTVHTVSATANDANMGNVTGGRYYADGETATISAVPVSGYKFVRWNDGTTTNPLVFTVTGDTEIEAMFVDESTPVYTVSVGVASASANFGSVSGGGVFISGEPVSLTASAIEHYQFVKWSNNETANPYNFNVSSNVDVAAVFEPMNYNVTVVAENGIVTNGDGPRKYGTWTTISVQAAEHYHFVGWLDGQTSTTRTEQVLGDLEFTALFEKDKYQINAWADNDATVSGTGEYEYEATATLTVTPAEGYHFVKWSDDATAQNPRQIVVDKNLDLYAQTAINEYQVTVDAANGSVEGITNPYNHGSEGTFTAVPADGYRFVRWSATNRENPFTMQITSNVVLRPLFASPDDDVYDVVVSATEGGAVTGGGIFLKDEKTTITATPDQGYHFVKWSNGKTETSFELTVTESVNLKAEFDKNVHTLTVSAGANGTVTGGGTVEAGSSAEISATAAEGYHFVKWSDGNTSASRTVVVDKDIELTAEFAINTYAVKASATNGKVEGAGNYNHGAEATLTATAAEGYHFVKWSDGVETATRKVTVKSDLSFTAEFAINTYAVKVTAANGTATGEGTYEHGAKAKLSVTAAEGYHFVKWSDGETKATRTVVVTDNVTLTAEFEINSYTVSASATNGTGEGTGTYNYGAEATLTAVANTGYHFTKWSDGVETATRKVTVKSDLSFTAEFVVNSYTISVDSAANGTITGAGTYTYGATATLEAKANKGYHFVMWTDSVMTATRTVEVTGNATFSAVFAGDSYELTVKAKNGTVEGAGTYENGTEATLTAVADAGYIFSKWDDDNTDNPRTVTVTGNKTYTATFKKALYSVTVNAENGQITGAADSLELGATVTLTAIADEGYHFVMWSDSVTENPRTVTLTAELLQQVKDSIEFTAIFEVNTDVADEAAEAVNIFAYGNTIVVENAVSDIFVYNAMGRLIERVAAEAGRTEIKIDGAGIHVVKTGNTAKRVMIND